MLFQVKELILKYNQPTPRYTSYPTVPQWENTFFAAVGWMNELANAFNQSRHQGISLYIHLPYCESLCTYCGCNTRITVNHGVEEPYINALLAEWNLYTERLGQPVSIRELHLGGGTPTFFSPQNLEKLVRGILTKATLAPKADLSFEGHPNNTTFDHLQTLRSLGFNRVSFGVQDVSPKVQSAINRVQPFENTVRVVEQARQLGYTSVNIDLVYGLPFQTMDDLKNSVSKVMAVKPDRVAYYSYAHVPWKKKGQRKFTEDDLPPADEKFKMFSWAAGEFKNNDYVQIGMDHFALPHDDLSLAVTENRLHRNFMGYTHQKTEVLIGLGCSAISDCGTAYAQNFTTVEAYVNEISEGQLAVCKGHFLSEEDKLLRQKITELMCRGTIQLAGLTDGLLQQILHRLNELEHDGLVTVTGTEVNVTAVGWRFLRNVAQCFDQRMYSANVRTQPYSKAV